MKDLYTEQIKTEIVELLNGYFGENEIKVELDGEIVDYENIEDREYNIDISCNEKHSICIYAKINNGDISIAHNSEDDCYFEGLDGESLWRALFFNKGA